jgi:hypothetical protein
MTASRRGAKRRRLMAVTLQGIKWRTGAAERGLSA